jgi:peptidyl-prolyl cis-trans isomerase SurA
MKNTKMRRIFLALATVGLLATTAPAAWAQDLFSPAIRINDRAITYYELEQRALLLDALNSRGNLTKQAREQLIDDRLKLDAAAQQGIRIEQEALLEGIKEFAARGNMTPEQFSEYLESNDVAPQTFQDFMYANLAWRDLVRARFAARAVISETDISKAMRAMATNSATQVLLSEIMIPMPQGREDEAMALAQEVAAVEGIANFADAARRFSAANSRNDGGKLEWTAVSQLPEPLQPIIMALKPGDVTEPIPLRGAIAIFQLRDLAESAYRAPRTAALEYATYLIPGGRTAEALATAQKIMDDSDTCDDLYGHAKGQSNDVLTINTQKPGDVPRDIALELAKLDGGEFSTNLTSNDGQTLVMVMLCERTPALNQEASREELTAQLRNRRLQALSDGYLEQLRADARIIEQ